MPPAICAARIRSRRARAARRPVKHLRGLEQRMQGARPEERRRAMGDLQLEARQLADAERRLGNEASRTTPGAAGEDARRRLAAEQERLADRTAAARRVGEAAGCRRRPAGRAAGDVRSGARARSPERWRAACAKSAQAMRQGDRSRATESQAPASTGRDRARARQGRPINSAPARRARRRSPRELSDQLSRAQELRDRLSRLQRRWTSSRRRVARPARAGAPNAQPSRAQDGREGSTGQQGSSAGGRDGTLSRLQREVDEQMRDAQQLAEEMQRENPGHAEGRHDARSSGSAASRRRAPKRSSRTSRSGSR